MCTHVSSVPSLTLISPGSKQHASHLLPSPPHTRATTARQWHRAYTSYQCIKDTLVPKGNDSQILSEGKKHSGMLTSRQAEGPISLSAAHKGATSHLTMEKKLLSVEDLSQFMETGCFAGKSAEKAAQQVPRPGIKGKIGGMKGQEGRVSLWG